MNCAPFPIFPIELFEHILDNLADVAPDVTNTDRYMALRACTLVCKAFVALSRRHLFRDINIGYYPGQEISVSRLRLIEVLKRNPAISPYIRGVTYTFHSTKELEELKRARGLGNYLSYYADEYSTSLYELFQNIHTLCIRRGPFAQPHEPNYDPDYAGTKKKRFALYHAILRDFAGSLTHNVTNLTICGLPMGLLDFLIFPSLQSLVLVDVLWLRISKIIQRTLFQLEPPSRIERITIESGEPFPIDILRFLPNLVHFDAGVDLLSSHEVWPIFLNRDDYHRKIVVYNKLQHVVIGDVGHFVAICDAADSGNTPKHAFPALYSLKISISPITLGMAAEIDGIYKLLRHSPNLKQLEILDLDARPTTPGAQLDNHIGRYGTSLEHLRLEYVNTDNLAAPHSVLAICDALSSLEGNNHLKTLKLNVCVGIGQVQEWFRTFSGAWKRVDQMLGGNEKAGFPYLEELRVSLVICDIRPRYVGWDVVEVPEIHEFDSEETFWGLWAGCLTFLHSNSRVTRRYDPNFDFKYLPAKPQCYQLEFLRF